MVLCIMLMLLPCAQANKNNRRIFHGYHFIALSDFRSGELTKDNTPRFIKEDASGTITRTANCKWSLGMDDGQKIDGFQDVDYAYVADYFNKSPVLLTLDDKRVDELNKEIRENKLAEERENQRQDLCSKNLERLHKEDALMKAADQRIRSVGKKHTSSAQTQKDEHEARKFENSILEPWRAQPKTKTTGVKDTLMVPIGERTPSPSAHTSRSSSTDFREFNCDTVAIRKKHTKERDTIA